MAIMYEFIYDIIIYDAIVGLSLANLRIYSSVNMSQKHC